MNYKIVLACIAVAVVLLVIILFFNREGPPLNPHALVKAYAKEKGKSFAVQNLQEGKDFNAVVGPIFFRYTTSSNELLASGYVASGQVSLVNKRWREEWDYIMKYAVLQPTTLGGGELEIYTGELDPISKKPVVYITRKYSSYPSEKQFIKDMNWLARSSTYWRDERWGEIHSARTDEELRREATEAEEWAQSQK